MNLLDKVHQHICIYGHHILILLKFSPFKTNSLDNKKKKKSWTGRILRQYNINEQKEELINYAIYV